MGHIKLSVIIPSYNVELYIKRCAESTLNQNLSKDEYEVIFVNDGTKDNSVEVLNKAIDFEKYPNFHIYNKENGGLSSARNFGLDKAHGDYVWFVDSDDWIEPNCLAKIVKKLNEINPDILYIYADEYEGNKVYKRGNFNDFGVVSGKYFLENIKKYNCAPFYIYKRSYLFEHGFMFHLGLLHEDNEFTPKVLYHAAAVTSIEGYFYHIFRHPGSITWTPNPKRLFDLIKIAMAYKEFAKKIPKQDRYLYCNVIGNNINQAMFECPKYSMDIQQSVNSAISSGKFSAELFNSSIKKYKLEGLLFSIFPKKCLKVYSFLQMFNRDKGGQKKMRQLES